MTGYDIYVYCRYINGWKKPELDTYLKSSEYTYFEALSRFFSNKKLDDDAIKKIIEINYKKNLNTFNYYDLMDESTYNDYLKWMQTLSSKNLYYETVKNSFDFIINFCIKNKLDFDTYKNKYGIKHVREKKIDYAVAYYLNLVDIDKLKISEKIILKKYISQIKVIKMRIVNDELKIILESKKNEMEEMFKYIKN